MKDRVHASIAATRKTGDSPRCYQLMLLTSAKKTRAFVNSSCDVSSYLTPFKGRFLRKRVFVLLHAELVHCYIIPFLVLDVFADCCFVQANG